MKLLDYLRRKSKRQSLESQGRISLQHSNRSEQSLDSEGASSNPRRILNSDWPIFNLVDTDFVEYDDNVSIVSVDTSIWKSAPTTDNEAPPIISKAELGKHQTNVDAWIAVSGMVYDVTTFLDKHPGGYQEIWKGVGKNATKIFMTVHPAVNIKKYVGEHCVGVFIPRSTKRVPAKRMKDNQQTKLQLYCTPSRFCRKKDQPEQYFELKFSQNETLVILNVKAVTPVLSHEVLDADSWTFVLWDNQVLFIKVSWSPLKSWMAQYSLCQEIENESIFVSFREKNSAIVMIPKRNKSHQPVLKKFDTSQKWTKGHCFVLDHAECEFDDSTRALLFYRKPITPKISLYGFKLRHSSYFGIPMGHSLCLTVGDAGAQIYPTSFTLIGTEEPLCEIKGQTFYFIISQEFKVSRELNLLESMDEKKMMDAAFICIGNPKGTFDWRLVLENVDTLVLLASGLGIAPLSRILRHFRDTQGEHGARTNVLLLYFNKTKSDIIWFEELVEANAQYSWFHLFLIVEEPDASWEQLIGSISTHLVKWCVNAIPGVSGKGLVVRGLASGDHSFLESCQRVFQNMTDYLISASVLESASEVTARPKN